MTELIEQQHYQILDVIGFQVARGHSQIPFMIQSSCRNVIFQFKLTPSQQYSTRPITFLNSRFPSGLLTFRLPGSSTDENFKPTSRVIQFTGPCPCDSASVTLSHMFQLVSPPAQMLCRQVFSDTVGKTVSFSARFWNTVV